MEQIAPAGKNRTKLFLIIAAIVVAGSIACCSVGGAIAIPAFLRVVRKSQVVEADAMMRQLSGAVSRAFAKDCAMPPALPPSGPVQSGGAKYVVGPEVNQAWSPIGFVWAPDALHFSYSGTPSADGQSYELRAEHNFKETSPQRHTILVTLTKDGDCALTPAPTVTLHEFE